MSNSATAAYGIVAVFAGLVIVVIAWWSLSARPDFVLSSTPSLVPAFALILGWLLTSPQQRPWYDLMLFPLLALLPRTRLDLLIIVRCTVSCVAFVPGMPTLLRPHWLEYAVHQFYAASLASRILDLCIAAITLTGLLFLFGKLSIGVGAPH